MAGKLGLLLLKLAILFLLLVLPILIDVIIIDTQSDGEPSGQFILNYYLLAPWLVSVSTIFVFIHHGSKYWWLKEDINIRRWKGFRLAISIVVFIFYWFAMYFMNSIGGGGPFFKEAFGAAWEYFFPIPLGIIGTIWGLCTIPVLIIRRSNRRGYEKSGLA